MSIAVMSWIWKNSPTSGSERLILLAIADSANDEGVAWPSMETLAKKANLSRRYVIDILAKLEDEKHLAIERRRDGPRNKSNIYTVLMVNKPSLPSEESITKGSEEALTRVVNHTSPDPSLKHNKEPSVKRARTPKHPALQAIFSITGRNPRKEDEAVFVDILGDAPDMKLLTECWAEWRAERPGKKPYSPMGYGWVTDWYRNGGPNTNGKKPTRKPPEQSAAEVAAILLAGRAQP